MSVDESATGYAEALHYCPHVNYVTPFTAEQKIDVNDNYCTNCENKQQNWVCLTCKQIFCGRFAKGHMLAHANETSHPIAAGFGDLSFWCYACDSYLHHLTMPEIFTAYCVLHMLKFNEPPAIQPAFDINDDEIKDKTTQLSPPPLPTSIATSTPLASIEGLTAEHYQHPVINRILGTIYGNCLGDAYGLATEFLDKAEVDEMYGSNPNNIIPFPHFKRNFHNSRWKLGDWTDDSDQMILIMQSLLAHHAVAVDTDFAARLKQWCRNGFPELGDKGGMGLGMTVASVVQHKLFDSNPSKAAEAVWIQMKRNAGANGAVMRTSILGCHQYTDMKSVISNTLTFARTTHVDPRCTASCLMTTTAIAQMLNGAPCETENEIKTIINEALRLTKQFIDFGSHENEFLRYVNCTSLEQLQLDEPKSIGYTLKCMGAGLYGLRSSDDFIRTLNLIIREAGDADTNGAVAGALVGCRLGYTKLPQEWLLAMPNKQWLDKQVVEFLKMQGLVK